MAVKPINQHKQLKKSENTFLEVLSIERWRALLSKLSSLDIKDILLCSNLIIRVKIRIILHTLILTICFRCISII